MTMRFGGWLTAGMLVCLTSYPALATERHVPGEYGTIQAAIDACVAGDVVIVADGTYTGAGNKNLDFKGKAITLRSASGDPNTCIIDCQASGRGLYFHTGETAAAVVRGFTIRNGLVTINSPGSPGGGGVYCNGSGPTISDCTITGNSAVYGAGLNLTNSSPTIANNTITGNAASDNGGGLHLFSSSPTITNNTIAANNSYQGGGLYMGNSSPTIANNTIAGNSALSQGGGLFLAASSATIANNRIMGNITPAQGGGLFVVSSASSLTIANNAILGNRGSQGGGLYLSSPAALVTNNTIMGNGASTGGGLFLSSPTATIANTIVAFNSSGIDVLGDSPTLRNNCAYGNSLYNYTGITDPTGTDGNISTDPAVEGLTYGGWHLRPDSPCMDAGNNADVYGGQDLDGQARVQPAGGTVDIGADESDGTIPPAGPFAIVRVSLQGDDGHDGSSWELAKRTVQAGIQAAAAASGGEVWVRAGTYYEAITLRPFAHVYGGFDGLETTRDERDWRAHVTTLDGQQQGSVVTASQIVSAISTLDGFTITHGSAENGGGLNLSYASPTVANNKVTDNSASSCGGGLYLDRSSPAIANNTITANSTSSSGGGLYMASSSPMITDSTVTGNSASEGGGLYLSHASATIENNKITGNSASSSGGGLYLSYSSPTIANNTIMGNSTPSSGGGLYLSNSSPTIANNTIVGNGASSGGALYVTASYPTIANTIVAFNMSGIYGSGGSLTLRSNCVYGNSAYNYSGVADPTGTNGNISSDPAITDWVYGGWHLEPNSPCVDTGNYNYTRGNFDLDGQPRIQPLGGTLDIGADESDGTTPPAGPFVIVRVSPLGDDSHDGSSWELAMRTVQAGIQVASALGGEVWVAAGTYYERITLRPFAHMYGGFSGVETARDARDCRAYVTTLDGQHQGSVVTAAQLISGVSTLDGFTIAHGSAENGGGLYLSDASPAIANNAITSNTAQTGGGLYLANGALSVTGCTLSGNAAASGGALYLDTAGTVSVSNSSVLSNRADGFLLPDGTGGGVTCKAGRPRFANCVFARNLATNDGGAVYCDESDVSLVNCTVANNIAIFLGGGLRVGGAAGRRAYVRNCIFWGNSSGLGPELALLGQAEMRTGYSDVQRGLAGAYVAGTASLLWGLGNIDADPRFADPQIDSYSLLAGSPCIDAGDNFSVPETTDLAGHARKVDDPATPDTGLGTPPIVDMGACEFHGTTHLTGDLNCDGVISFADINPFVLAISSQSGYEAAFPNCRFLNADINGDGVVSYADINPFVQLLAGK